MAILGGCSSAAAPREPAAPTVVPVAPVASHPLASSSAPTIDEVKDKVVAQINAPTGSGLYDLFGPPMRQQFTREQTTTFAEQVRGARGPWRNAKRAPEEDAGGHHGTWRIEAERGAWQLEIYVDRDAKISGLKVTPASAEHAVVRNSQSIGLPFRGEWSVLWGGDREEVNRHVVDANQRRAVDLLMTGADGKTHRGSGRLNSDYFAYGQDVLAVANGTVVTVVDGVPENEPGAPNRNVIPGNYVVLRHAEALYSVYEHLQPGKIVVKRGDNVPRGAVIGNCGNSGNSSEPHLHFQLQDGPSLDVSSGVEAVFDDVIVSRGDKTEHAKGYVFLKGDRLRPSP
jgi:murein DD-endopeptidase MepM/ murein hydrolase activator NlpD